MHTILDTVDHAAARGRTVYVHCVGGIGRTGTVAGCWLVRHGCSGTEALAIIAERWKTVAKHIWHWKSPDYGEQREFVMAWHEQTSPGNRIDFVRLERVIRGSLLGGAVGDARGAITNKTQMTLFSAEAMLRAEAQRRVSGTRSLEEVAFRAYQRWLRTQLDQGDSETPGSGWLMNQPELRHQRAPGKTCLASAGVASLALVSNNSKGCGGVMRAAPAGLFDAGGGAERAYDDGVALAHASHRHPAGYVAAGVLAVLIGALTEGDALDTAVHRALAAAAAHRMESPEVAESLEKAVRLAESGVAQSPELLRQLGAGRIAEEALAIAVYCALMADGDFARGVQLAVNHGGDSDSTGSISGSILGAALGVAAIPGRWVERVEAREVIVQIADDLLTGWRDGVKWAEMYPAN
ncbi:MAG TPA: ADP-ribosylglycohydrolase family protein [Gemmatimonadaceae bacterium]|nr:ADP-ribosylglycohydrolase family protein [Gemmatimonadaceae bacterium]